MELRHVLDRKDVPLDVKQAIRNSLISNDSTKYDQIETLLRQRTQDLRLRVKELTCIYRLSRLVGKISTPLEEIFHQVLLIIPQAWEYPDITCVRIIFEDKAYSTDNFQETPWMQAANIMVSKKKAGILEIYYLEEKPEIFEGPFREEERNLIDIITIELGQFIDHKRAEEAIERKRKWLKVILTSMGDAVIATDIYTKITFFNSAAEKLTGWPAEEALDRQVKEVFHLINEKTRHPVENSVDQALREGKVIDLPNHVILIARNGREIPLDGSSSPIHDTNGKTYGMVLIFRSKKE